MPKAIVLGGTHDHITLVQSLKNRGYYTILVDYFENPPARTTADLFIRESILDTNAIIAIAQREKPDLIVAACIDQALLTMAYVSEKLNIKCHLSYQTALNLTNKTYMKKLFCDNDIPTAKFSVIENSASEISPDLTYPLVVKPSDSNSSKGILKVLDKSELDNAVTSAMQHSRSHKVIVEEFIDGEEYSVDVIIKEHEATVLMISQNLKMKQNLQSFTIVQNIYLSNISETVQAAIKEIAENIARAFELDNVPLLIQLLVKNDRISVIEFSARIGGGSKHHFIKRMSGCDILNYYVDVLTGTSTAITVSKSHNHAAMNYIYTNPGIIDRIEGVDKLKQEGIIEEFFYYKTPGMAVANHSSSADRPAGFMALADSQKELYDKIMYADSELNVLDDKGQDIMLHGLFENTFKG